MEAVDANWVLKQMEYAGNRMNIIILDACRNNPLPPGTRSLENGLARMDAPTGSFIAYSTAPGAAALDGAGSNSAKSTYPLVEDGLPCDDGFAQTAPVDALAANAFGLKGMIGNAWEWVADCYHPSYEGAPVDGGAWVEDACTERVIRGSSYLNNAWQSRFAMRDKAGPNSREATIGFRLARDL